MATKLDHAANVAIIVASLSLCGTLVFRGWLPDSRQPRRDVYGAGDRVEAVDAAVLQGSNRTLLMVIRSTCHFCSDSMSFYQRLAARRGTDANRTRLVAVSDEPVEVTEKYLTEHNVGVDRILQVKSTLRVIGTPTLILVDGSGIVQRSWVGRLREDAEKEVVAAMISKRG